MRLFLGTFLNAANQDFYGRFVGDLTGKHGDILRAIPHRSAHLTYAFCADTRTSTVDALLDALRQVAAGHHAIEIRVGSPHVISAGPIPRLVVGEVVTGGERLHRLTADLGARCQAAFRDLEWRPSREPHVTLARFRKHARRSDGDTIVRALGVTDSARVLRDDRVATVQVIESTLTATGPAYTVVGEVTLP